MKDVPVVPITSEEELRTLHFSNLLFFHPIEYFYEGNLKQGICTPYAALKHLSGIIVIKDEHANIIYHYGSSLDLYRSIHVNIKRHCLGEDTPRTVMAIILCKPGYFKKIKRTIKKTWFSVPVNPQQIDMFDILSNEAPQAHVEKLVFYPLFKGTKERRLTNLNRFMNRPGVYVLKEDGKIVNIGKASVSVYTRVIRKFLKHTYENKYDLSYYPFIGTRTYTFAVVEVPDFTRFRKRSIHNKVFPLEKRLIAALHPRDNIAGNVIEQREEWYEEVSDVAQMSDAELLKVATPF